MLIICHEDDAMCSGGFFTVEHLTYADDADSAALLIIQKASE
jgi:cutinase